eukprot:239130_1
METEMTNAYDDDVNETLINPKEEDTKTIDQSDAPSQPEHPEQPEQKPKRCAYCINIFNWFPLRFLSFIGGILLIVVPILDLFIPPPVLNPVKWFIYAYLILFGFVIIIIEAPTFICTKRCQLGMYFWARWLSRMWGRAVFYSFVAFFCYSEGIFILLVGVYLTIMSLCSLLFSILAARKFRRMREYIAAGTELNEELAGRFMRKYDELATNSNEQKIGSTEIVKVAEQAGRILSNAERHAIQTFLDESCNGYVTKEDWMKQFVEQYEKNGFKQKFL